MNTKTSKTTFLSFKTFSLGLTVLFSFFLLFSTSGCGSNDVEQVADKAAKQYKKTKRTYNKIKKHRPLNLERLKETTGKNKPASKTNGSNSKSSGSSSASAKTTNCSSPKTIQNISFSKTKYPMIYKHWQESIEKEGWPSVYVINRAGAPERRKKLLANIPTKPGYDRDEQPAAALRGKNGSDTKGKKFSLEEGSSPTGWKSSVMYVPSSENRSHGSSLGTKMRRFCDGVQIRFVFY